MLMLKASDMLIPSYDLYREMLSGGWQIMSYYMVENLNVIKWMETMKDNLGQRLKSTTCTFALFSTLAISCS